ncbi:hypothetical protein PInf_003431 [Phytophthora infestans]|nr:hypothetical protein PInf_003431 [Phytophthora infestans]
MPPHIKEAKLLKKNIDEKAGVTEMDDGADVDGQFEDEEDDQPDFSFDLEGVDDMVNTSAVSATSLHSATNIGEVSVELMDSAAGREGLEAFANTSGPSPVCTRSSQRQDRSTGLPKPNVPQASTSSVISVEKTASIRADDTEYSKRYHTSSNRLGGGNLAEIRSISGRKRGADGDDDLSEASYAKVKRVKATEAANQLKKRLSDLETDSSAVGGNIVEMMILMREDSERRGEARRADEEQRRRNEVAAREALWHAEKLEAEERRRQEKMEMEERARRDREEARARSQELMYFIGALFKKE